MSEPLRVLFCDDSGGALRAFTKEVAEAMGDGVEATTAASIEGFRQRAEADGWAGDADGCLLEAAAGQQ